MSALSGTTFAQQMAVTAVAFLGHRATAVKIGNGGHNNAHELPMMLAALADDDAGIAAAPYRVLEEWQAHYDGNLLIALPDAFGTTAFLRDAPGWLVDWTGFRPDSMPPIEGDEQIIAWWKAHGRDPRTKLLIFSDGMDIDSIEATYRHFHGRVQMSFGWGTNLTNDFRGCDPAGGHGLEPISLVAKVTSANGRHRTGSGTRSIHVLIRCLS